MCSCFQSTGGFGIKVTLSSQLHCPKNKQDLLNQSKLAINDYFTNIFKR